MSPSDFPWGRGNLNPVPREGGVPGRLPLSRVSSTKGQPRRQPSPALAGRDPSGAIQQGPEKYPVRKGGVKTWREGRQSKNGPGGRTTKFHQFGQDGPGQPSPSSSLTGAVQQSHSSSPSGPPLSGSASGSYWTPASQVEGVTQNIPAGIRVPGEGKSKISGREDWEGETQLSEGDTDSEGDHLDWWGCRVCGGWWRTTGRIGWEESREEGDGKRGRGQKFHPL